jgi:hypothetical protein
LTTGHEAQAAGHEAQAAGHEAQAAGHQAQAAGHQAQAAGHQAQAAGRQAQAAAMTHMRRTKCCNVLLDAATYKPLFRLSRTQELRKSRTPKIGIPSILELRNSYTRKLSNRHKRRPIRQAQAAGHPAQAAGHQAQAAGHEAQAADREAQSAAMRHMRRPKCCKMLPDAVTYLSSDLRKFRNSESSVGWGQGLGSFGI